MWIFRGAVVLQQRAADKQFRPDVVGRIGRVHGGRYCGRVIDTSSRSLDHLTAPRSEAVVLSGRGWNKRRGCKALGAQKNRFRWVRLGSLFNIKQHNERQIETKYGVIISEEQVSQDGHCLGLRHAKEKRETVNQELQQR